MPGQGPVPCPSVVAGADVISTHRADVIIKCADVNSHRQRQCQHKIFLNLMHKNLKNSHIYKKSAKKSKYSKYMTKNTSFYAIKFF